MTANPKTVTAIIDTKTTADSFVKGIDHAVVFKFYQAIDNNQVKEVSELLTGHSWLRESLNHPNKLLGKISPLLNYNQMCYLDIRKNLPSTRIVYQGQFDEEGRPKNLDHVLWFPSAAYPLFRAMNTGNPDMVRVFLGLADPTCITPYDLCYGLLDGEFSLSKLSGKAISTENQKEILRLMIMAGYDPDHESTYHYSTPNTLKVTRSVYNILLAEKEEHGFNPVMAGNWIDCMVEQIIKRNQLKEKAEKDTLNQTELLIEDEPFAVLKKSATVATGSSTATVSTITTSSTMTFSTAAGSASAATLPKPASTAASDNTLPSTAAALNK